LSAIRFHSNPTNGGYPLVREYLAGGIGTSAFTIRAGDLMVLTTSYARAAVTGDITSSFLSTSVYGILGIAMHDVSGTATNGYPTGAAIAPGGSGAPTNYPTYQLSNYAQGLASDTASGRAKILVAIANESNVFRAPIISATAQIAATRALLQGHPAGLIYSANASTYNSVWQVDSAAKAAAGALLTIVDIDDTQPNYNSTTYPCEVAFRFLNALFATTLSYPAPVS
jgi:hypothetical protein